jgi:tripartite ATP-independent transporter DctM subunit
MSVALATIIMFSGMVLLLALGLPIAFAMGGSAVLFGLATRGMDALFLMYAAVITNVRTIILIAIPLFVFMGNILEVSGLADDLFDAAQKWFGGLRGGLAVATVAVCTVFAACTGVSAASTVTMGLVAFPSMLKRNYDKKMAAGCVMAGGALGQLIPPGLMFILYAFLAQESVGRLFAGGIIPGLILAGLFISYVLIRCYKNPAMGPEVPREERANGKEKLLSLKAIVLPILLVMAVLGSIFSGFATPTEAAAVGAAGSIVCAIVYRRFTWRNLYSALSRTLSLTAMIMWIVVGATAFTCIFTRAGGMDVVRGTLLGLEVHPLVVVLMMQAVLFVLGMFMDPSGIILLCAPIFVPVVKELGFSPVWFGVLFVINMEMAFLSPPYGINLFYIRGIAPEDVTMTDIYLSALPFIIIQAIGLALTIAFPIVALWIPNLIFGAEVSLR